MIVVLIVVVVVVVVVIAIAIVIVVAVAALTIAALSSHVKHRNSVKINNISNNNKTYTTIDNHTPPTIFTSLSLLLYFA